MQPSSPEISPLDVASVDLVPLRLAKLPGQTQLSFSGLLSPPLLLHEDLRDGCGGQLWPAGMVLAKFLLQRTGELRNKTIIELGAGGGLVGLALASSLYHSTLSTTDAINGPTCVSSVNNQPSPTVSQQTPILLTDLPILIPLQNRNITLNGLPAGLIQATSLPWGMVRPLPDTVPLSHRRPDVILAADCVYFEPAFPLLLETLGELMYTDSDQESTKESGKGDYNEEPVCYFSMKKRRKADMRFVKELKKKFEVVDRGMDVRSEERTEDEKGVYLYEVRRKVKRK